MSDPSWYLSITSSLTWCSMECICEITRIRSRSVSSSTDALDSDQARHTTQRILQHTRSLPTDSPVPYIPSTDREYRSDSGLSDRYTVRTPIATSANRSTYKGYSREKEDYASVGSIMPTSSSAGMFVKPRTKTMSRHGSPMQKKTMQM